MMGRKEKMFRRMVLASKIEEKKRQDSFPRPHTKGKTCTQKGKKGTGRRMAAPICVDESSKNVI